MAISRFSQIFSPSDYVQPFDLGVYAQLIQQRQGTYDRNVDIASNELGKYTNLPILHPGAKAYANQKVREVSNNLNGIYQNADYGDPNVFRQVRGHISSIASDPIIVNGISSAANIQADQEALKEAKKNKTFAYQNAMMVQQGIQSYLNNPDPSASYSAQGYQPYVDHVKPITEILSKAKNDGQVELMLPDPSDPNKQVLTKITTKELTGDRVDQVVESLWTPEQQLQLDIDANFVFRGYKPDPNDPNSVQWITSTAGAYYGKRLQAIQKAQAELNANRQIMLNQNPNADVSRFKTAEEGYKNEIDFINNLFSNPQNLYKNGVEQLQSLKSWQYREDLKRGYRSTFAHREVDAGTSNYDNSNGSNSSSSNTGLMNLSQTNFGVPGATGITSEPVTDPALYAKSDERYLIKDIQDATAEIQTSAMQAYSNASALNPTKYSPGNQAQVIAEWDKLYNEGNFDALPQEALEHYSRISQAKTKLDQANQIKSMVDQRVNADPEYIKAVNGLNGLKKVLKDEYNVPIYGSIKGVGIDTKKKYSKDAIMQFASALAKTNQKLSASIPDLSFGESLVPGMSIAYGLAPIWDQLMANERLDLSVELPKSQNGDNSLINDINALRKKVYETRNSDHKESPILGAISDVVTYGNNYSVHNPLYYLSQEHPELAKNLKAHGQMSNVVNSIKEKAFKDIGFVSMIPTVNLSGDQKVQNAYLTQAQSAIGSLGEEEVVREVVGLKALPDGQIQMDLTVGNSPQNATFKKYVVPRTIVPTFSSLLPEDTERTQENYLYVTKGTSPVMSQAPIAAFKYQAPNGGSKSIVVPYRIAAPSRGRLIVQFFNKNGELIANNSGNNVFSSLTDLNRNISALARNFWMMQNGLASNQTQTQTFK